MSTGTIFLNDELYQYYKEVSVRKDPLLQALIEETAKLPKSIMQISEEQGQFMALLISLMQAKCTIEVGVFTGYSSLVVARALPADGMIIACDINAEWTEIAKRYWKQAKVDHKIQLKIAPAKETLTQLLEQGEAETFDFAFIDADKAGYPDYYELCLQLLRTGGVIMLDNTFMHGSVLTQDKTDRAAQAIKVINEKLYNDERVDLSMLPLGDGITLARKR